MVQFFKKSFGKWFDIKPKVDKKKYPSFRVKLGEVFWYHCGENIGTEVSGKGSKFFRPAVIYTVLSFKAVVVIPLTTAHRVGSWYVEINSLKRKSFACLNHVQSIDKKRLDVKLGEITSDELSVLYQQFSQLYTKKDPSNILSEGREELSS